MIGVVSRAAPHVKIPEWEQVLSAGAACMNMVVAARALGYLRRPGSPNGRAYDARFRAAIGLAEHERIAGFIHIGRARRDRGPAASAARRDRDDVSGLRTPTMFYETGERDKDKLPHDPFKAIVAPRPIGWISTRAQDGRVNLAPYSFFNGFCSAPPIVGFSSEEVEGLGDLRQGERRIRRQSGDASICAPMNATSAPLPRGENEFDPCRADDGRIAGSSPRRASPKAPPRSNARSSRSLRSARPATAPGAAASS